MGCVSCARGVGAAAAVLLAGTVAAQASPIIFGGFETRMYRGGALEVGDLLVVEQGFGEPFSFEHPSGSFSAGWSMGHMAADVGGVWDLTITVSMLVTASVDGGEPSGMAQAFAGVSDLRFDIQFGGLPRIYTGVWPLIDWHGTETFQDGDTIQPGAYTLVVSGLAGFPTDVQVMAGPGQNNSNSLERMFDFRLTVIPAPGAGVVVLSAGGLLLGRRRRRGGSAFGAAGQSFARVD